MPILTIDELVKKNAEIVWDSIRAKSMDDFVSRLKAMETACDYLIIQSIDDNLRPTNNCFAIGESSIIAFQFGDDLPNKFEIIPLNGRVKAVNLKEHFVGPSARAMIEIKLDTEVISIKTELPLLDPMVRKVCFRIAGSHA